MPGADATSESASAAWAVAARASIRRSIEVETAIDRDYATLASRVLALADRRVKRADVRGLTRLRDGVLDEDARLGGKRPQQLDALLATLNQKLDAGAAAAARARSVGAAGGNVPSLPPRDWRVGRRAPARREAA